MAEKKDKGLLGGAAAASKKGIEELGRLVDTIGGLVPDAAVGVVNSTKGKTIHGSREALKLQRSLFKGTLGVVDSVQKHAGKVVESAVTGNEKMPAEARELMREWTRVMRVGRDELKAAVEKSFDLVDQYLARAEKTAKTSCRKCGKAAAPKAAVKKAAPAKPAKAKAKPKAKKAPAKKAAPKKPAS